MALDTEVGSSYSNIFGFIFVYNLIIGVGALALPFGFKQAGLILGTILLIILAILSYVTITFIIEAEALANAHLIANEEEDNNGSAVVNYTEEKSEPQFFINKRVEMAPLVELFLGRIGKIIFSIIIIIYLYGDLAIYSVTIPQSLAQVTHGFKMGSVTLTEKTVYYFYLGCFAAVVCPFCFFNFQKTKYLQFFTMFNRNLALWTMIVISCLYITNNKSWSETIHKSETKIPLANFTQLPSLFGVAIYAYMCHHSLPGIIAPMRDKASLKRLLAFDLIAVFLTYAILGCVALISFGDITNPTCDNKRGPPCSIQKLFTFNFTSYKIRFLADYLALFPVFTLSTNFPLIAITLRNNIMSLFKLSDRSRREFSAFFSLATWAPPIAIAAITDDVHKLVDFTGAYAGLFIMFIFPALIVYYGRRKTDIRFGFESSKKNPQYSPFSYPFPSFWVFFILGFSLLSLVLVIVKQILDLTKQNKI
eukprot:TRINITY_DN7976_c0_g2_i3.p1 TRINITY_DN7976_c0_g2~~TRINITY_DN7976_c0_g2_i3.p1  ORF type:complete len:478 (+),score=25.49 TRINITY_DN7976_c0_g2_i3:55-1488(+)